MEYYIYKGEDELYHYGVKGMRWGVRRYRNADGTLTSAGQRRVARAQKLADRFEKSRSARRLVDRANRAAGVNTKNRYYDPDFNSKYIDVKGRKIRVTDMGSSKSKLSQKVADWMEAEDARIRDELNYGKISKKEAQRRFDDLAEEADRRYSEIKNRRIYSGKSAVSNMSLMSSSINQMQTQQMIQTQQLVQQQMNQMAMQQMVQDSMRIASLGLSGGMNPFMFG